MSKLIRVGLEERGYDIHVGYGILAEAGRMLKPLARGPMPVVTDATVSEIHLAAFLESCGRAGLDAHPVVMPPGEGSKSFSGLADLSGALLNAGVDRGGLIVALGGGVTGDMAGFAAGCYLRGVRYVQIPTTLLAAVDSSVGGKTAVDLVAGKNLAGLFHQPSLVLCDTDTFATLSPDEFANGAAEAIKTGILDDEALFSLFETGDVRTKISEIVAQCVAFKARIVEADETETGIRKTLNLGHTAGHAIERYSDYTIPHGQAVAIGLAIIARAAEKLGWATEPIARRIEAALARNGLPVTTTFSPEALAQAALSDKKRAGGTITLVVPKKIGDCALVDLPVEQLLEVFRAGLEERA